MKNTLILLLAIVFAVAACNTNNVRGNLKNRREILQSSYWKLESATANGGATSFPKCQDDNYYNFEPGGSGRYEEGTDNCLDSTGTGNAPTYTPFIWEVTGDLRYIYIMNYGGDPSKRLEWQILDMDFKEMTVRQMLVVDGIDVRLDMRYKATPK